MHTRVIYGLHGAGGPCASLRRISSNAYAGHRGFLRQVSGLFFGTVRSTVASKTPVRAAKALCGIVWQLLSMRANTRHALVALPTLRRGPGTPGRLRTGGDAVRSRTRPAP